MVAIDLNCDMGEHFGPWRMGNDEALMDWITSANVACGFHAGDYSVIGQTVDVAIRKGVAIGAHPGYPDFQGFGRRSMQISPDEVYDLTLYQIGALYAFVRARMGRLSHVKPHGALYNDAAKDPMLARAIARAVFDFDKGLTLVGLAGSHLVREAADVGLRVGREGFADRTYQDDGTLTPRSMDNALISDPDYAARQVLKMVVEQKIDTVSGQEIPIVVDTVCIHGDGKQALPIAKAVVDTLKRNGITVKGLQ